jgi:hypothetical protein
LYKKIRDKFKLNLPFFEDFFVKDDSIFSRDDVSVESLPLEMLLEPNLNVPLSKLSSILIFESNKFDAIFLKAFLISICLVSNCLNWLRISFLINKCI